MASKSNDEEFVDGVTGRLPPARYTIYAAFMTHPALAVQVVSWLQSRS